MKAICIKSTDTLTYGKSYDVHHEYENLIELLNDRRYYQYYNKNLFEIFIHKGDL